MNDPKFVPTLRELDGTRRGTWNRGERNEFATGKAPATKARESWHVLGIMSEFIEAAERLADIRPAVSIFGSARIPAGTPEYILAEKIGRLLADSGFAVISGGGPGLMEAANKGAFEGKAPSVGLNIELPHEQKGNDYQDVVLRFRSRAASFLTQLYGEPLWLQQRKKPPKSPRPRNLQQRKRRPRNRRRRK